MKIIKMCYMVIFCATILLILNFYQLDFSNIDKGNVLGVGTGILIIISMLFTIKDLKKQKKKNR